MRPIADLGNNNNPQYKPHCLLITKPCHHSSHKMQNYNIWLLFEWFNTEQSRVLSL